MVTSISSSSFDVQDAAAMRKQMFQKLDQNGDGKITKDELKANAPQNGSGPDVEEIFSRVDTNQDGSIDESENDAFLKNMPPGPPPGARPPGGPSASEMAESLFKNADAEGDGKITKDELSSVLAQNGSAPDNIDEIWADTDADGDGYVTQAELETALQQMLEQMRSSSMPAPTSEASTAGYDRAGDVTTLVLKHQFSALA